MAGEYPTKQEMEVRRTKDAVIRSGLERPSETSSQARTAGGSKTATSAHANPAVVRLAERLGRDPEELAKSLPADTLRRLSSPMIEELADDGARVFKHDIGISEGIKPLR